MLDAYIIDRIQREREDKDRREGSQIPLYIEEMPHSENSPERESEPDVPDRGSLKIDFRM